VGVERARVVEVRPSASGPGPTFAGYLIGDRLVLTAGEAAGGAVRVAGTVTWYPAAPVWAAPAGGATILEVDEPLATPAAMRWGAVSGARPVPVTAMGLAPAAASPHPFREAEPFFGQLRAGTVEPAPASRATGEGLHGAALFAGAEVVGVIRAGRGRIGIEPAATFAADPSFANCVGPVALIPVRGPVGGLSIL